MGNIGRASEVADAGVQAARVGAEAIDAGVTFGKGIGGQGASWENFLTTQLPEGTAQLPTNFKTFDFFNPDTGVATSAKTLDTTTAAKLANPQQIYNSLQGNINSILDFTEYERSEVELNQSMIQSSELRVAVPANTTSAQWQQINRAIQYGKDNGVNVIVNPVK